MLNGILQIKVDVVGRREQGTGKHKEMFNVRARTKKWRRFNEEAQTTDRKEDEKDVHSRLGQVAQDI